MQLPSRGLYAITDAELIPDAHLLETVEQALLGGARLLQYRHKGADKTLRMQQAQALNALCRSYHVPLIINDDVALAATVGSAGVHLGEDDAPLSEARARLGNDAIIGVSCYACLERAVQAAHGGADYVAFGSFFASPTKPKAMSAPLALLGQAVQRLSVPIVAIGGITPSNGRALVAAGADFLAVVSGVFGQGDVRAAAEAYAALYDE